jgi:uncharacterized protein (TIGR00251 family)
MHSGTGPPFTATQSGLRLAVRLTPRAGRNGFDGVVVGSGGRPALQVKVAAAPVRGAANAALIAFLAEALKLPKSQIRIVSGETARLKLVDLCGDTDTIAGRLAAAIGS